MRTFDEKCGRTAGCSACAYSGGRHHSAECKRRQITFRGGRLGGEPAGPGQAQGPAGSSSEEPAENPSGADDGIHPVPPEQPRVEHLRPLAEHEGQPLRALEDPEGSVPKQVRLSISQDAETFIQGDAPTSAARVKRGAEKPLTEFEWHSRQVEAAP